MSSRRNLTLACLVPEGRAIRNADVIFAHANGRFLAERGATLLGDGTRGEVAGAMVSGCVQAGGTFRVATKAEAAPPSYPVAVETVELDETQDAPGWIGAEADGIWALPPRVGDLERYFDTWLGAQTKPVVCLARAGEFRLLRGIIDDVVRADRPRDAQRIVFAGSPAEGWELLDNMLKAGLGRDITPAG